VTQVWQCKGCKRVFPVPARISTEKRLSFASPDVTRVIVERSCCPFCECIELEIVNA
jgi:hypothetical protein